jgi:hypothetical protein
VDFRLKLVLSSLDYAIALERLTPREGDFGRYNLLLASPLLARLLPNRPLPPEHEKLSECDHGARQTLEAC